MRSCSIFAISLFLCIFIFASISTASSATAQPELVLQYCHSNRMHDASFAANSPLLAICDWNNYIDIWDTQNWTLKRCINAGIKRNHCEAISNDIALSPDGKLIASLNDCGEIFIWQTDSGQFMKKLPKAVGSPISVKWSGNGKRIAAGGNCVTSIWNVENGRIIRTFPAAGDVAFSLDGKFLGVADFYNAFIYDIASGRKIHTLREKTASCWPIVFSPDGKYIATGGVDPDMDSNGQPKDEDGRATTISGEPVRDEIKVKIWDAMTGKLVRMLSGDQLDDGTQYIKFSSDDGRLFASGSDIAYMWDLNTGKVITRYDASSKTVISPDDSLVISGSSRTVYNASGGQVVKQLNSPPQAVKLLTFLPDNTLVSADEWFTHNGIRLWNVDKGNIIRLLYGPAIVLHDAGYYSVDRIFVNGRNGTNVWNSATGELLANHKNKDRSSIDGDLLPSLVTPDGLKMICESEEPFNKSFFVRDMESHKLVSTISTKSNSYIDYAAISPNSKYFALWTYPIHEKGSAAIWNINTGKEVSVLEGIRKETAVLVFSPNGRSIAGLLSPAEPYNEKVIHPRIVIWNTVSGKIRHQISVGDKILNALAFSKDNNILAVGFGTSICLYNAKTLQQFATVKSGDSIVSSLAFSQDGKYIASGYADGRIRLWDTKTHKLIITMQSFGSPDGNKPSPDWLSFTPNGKYNWSPGASSQIKWRSKGKLYPVEEYADQLEVSKKNMEIN